MPVAVARAAAAGIVTGDVIVIGDTPLDVACARAHGAMALGVATGPYTVEQLTRAGADHAVESLDEVDVDWLFRLP
ncbi:MAG: HAD hydrolase-like protein [Vicinamibacterales bacterium]